MNKTTHLKSYLKELAPQGICLAYSGGVDSATLLALLMHLKTEALTFNLKILFFRSLFQSKKAISDALLNAAKLEATLEIVDFKVLSLPEMQDNPHNRCYLCKKELFSLARKIADASGVRFLLDGSNADDAKCHRPGKKAALELNVISPFEKFNFTKEEVRLLAQELSLPFADAPAESCLATRLPYGSTLTERVLQKIEQGEAALRSMGFEVLRLRCYRDGIATIEILPQQFSLFLEKKLEICSALKALGFQHITLDLEGFQSGSMDTLISCSDKLCKKQEGAP